MHPVTADRLLAATGSVRTTFDRIPADPVTIADPAHLGHDEAAETVRRYDRHGFAIMRLPRGPFTEERLLDVAGSLCLGEPFVPPLYTLAGRQAPKVSQISAARNAGTRDAGHPSFGHTVGQELHCDGTLQDIGYVKASLLLCEMPAASGGDSLLFNASAAFVELAGADLAAAQALTVPGTLVRRATINGSADVNAGPAFTVQDGRLVNRYSVTETDSWAVPAGVDAAALERGIRFLAAASQPGSAHFVQLRLDAGEIIVFDNTRISHGRTPYRDAPDRRRCMFRSLHLRQPRVPVLAADGARGPEAGR
ncbi:TauD/TfdA family dioxygenase [Micromonospora sp. NPDC018662]|uniref:TauD/TfdA family dioxygenase n=1 Tax=Micromonospora sp. NPDC018662 TaxID=3364238 RepID=UPI00378F33D0